MKNILGLAAAFALIGTCAAYAAQPISGQSVGGGHPTFLENKDGRQIDGGNDFTNDWHSTGNSLTSATPVAVKAAAGASKYICTKWIFLSGLSTTTAVNLTIKDGSTALFYTNILAGGAPSMIALPIPICGSANTPLNAVLSGSPTGAIDMEAGGYIVTN